MITSIWYSGIVVKGNQQGRKMGFPTANIQLHDPTLSIEKGIYAVNVRLNEKQLQGMLYVGTRPTLHLTALSIEIHIFNFDQEIYGEVLHFQLLKKFYEDKKFLSVEELIAHIQRYNKEIIRFFNE